MVVKNVSNVVSRLTEHVKVVRRMMELETVCGLDVLQWSLKGLLVNVIIANISGRRKALNFYSKIIISSKHTESFDGKS